MVPSAQLTTCYFTGGRISAVALVFVWRAYIWLLLLLLLVMAWRQLLLVGAWQCAAIWCRVNT